MVWRFSEGETQSSGRLSVSSLLELVFQGSDHRASDSALHFIGSGSVVALIVDQVLHIDLRAETIALIVDHRVYLGPTGDVARVFAVNLRAVRKVGATAKAETFERAILNFVSGEDAAAMLGHSR